MFHFKTLKAKNRSEDLCEESAHRFLCDRTAPSLHELGNKSLKKQILKQTGYATFWKYRLSVDSSALAGEPW